MDRRAKLLGLDAPARHELTLEALDAAIEDNSAQLAAARSKVEEGEGAPEDPG
jgi:hypothetical protein